MTVTYREQHQITRYTVRENIRTFRCLSYWKPEGTSLIYFRIDEFNIKTVGETDIVEITED